MLDGLERMKVASQSGARIASWGQIPSVLRRVKASLAGAENKGQSVAGNQIKPERVMDCLKMKVVPNIFMKTQGQKATQCPMPVC
jgi:hypothetical protein